MHNKQFGLALALLLACTAAVGQYKVVGPDGKVTYTDQPPTDGKSKVQPFRAGGSANDPDVVLPFATAQAARNFPVTLYTQEGCGPCDTGRTLLRARGIPFEEKTISSQADLDAFKAINRDGQLPLLTVGREQLAGYEAGRWNSALSTAGYPANTTLPNGYTPKKSALVSAPATAAAAAPAPSPATTAANPRAEASPGFRFQK
ncbi:MAG: glutaredoxin family protein [Burkholderiaceae bacterium]